MDEEEINVVGKPPDYVNYVPGNTSANQAYPQFQGSQPTQNTSLPYGGGGVVNQGFPSIHPTQGTAQHPWNGPPMDPGRNALPQYGMAPAYPQGVMFVQQPGTMPPPYTSYNPRYFPGQNQQQEHQPVVYYASGQPAPVMFQPVPPEPNQKRMGPVILSCFTIWFCGIFFGAIAFVLALVGRDAPNDRTGRNCATASYVFSIIGIVTGITLIIVLAVALTSGSYCKPSCSNGYYYQNGCRYCCEKRYCSYGSYTDSNGCKQCCSYSAGCPIYGINFNFYQCYSILSILSMLHFVVKRQTLVTAL